MLPFKREAVALVVLAFYFLVLDQQTQESRLQQLLLLQHLKRSRRKRLILLQIALRKTRRVNFTFRVGRIRNDLCLCFLPYFLRRPKPNVETWSRKRDRMRLTQSRHHRMWKISCDRKRMSVIQTLVTDLTMPARRVNQGLTFYCLERCLPGYQLEFTLSKYLPR